MINSPNLPKCLCGSIQMALASEKVLLWLILEVFLEPHSQHTSSWLPVQPTWRRIVFSSVENNLENDNGKYCQSQSGWDWEGPLEVVLVQDIPALLAGPPRLHCWENAQLAFKQELDSITSLGDLCSVWSSAWYKTVTSFPWRWTAAGDCV